MIVISPSNVKRVRESDGAGLFPASQRPCPGRTLTDHPRSRQMRPRARDHFALHGHRIVRRDRPLAACLASRRFRAAWPAPLSAPSPALGCSGRSTGPAAAPRAWAFSWTRGWCRTAPSVRSWPRRRLSRGSRRRSATGRVERTLEAEYTLASGFTPEARFARGEDGQLASRETQARDLFGGQKVSPPIEIFSLVGRLGTFTPAQIRAESTPG